jgi:16S rRNA (cytosine967-C5)-methyltransferase
VIGKFVSKKLDDAVRTALRLGLYQLHFLDRVPAYSAINESVNLVQKAKKTSAKGLVNAVLRKAGKENCEFTFDDEIDEISVTASHPRWLVEKWIGEFGIEETRKLAHANNDPARLDFRTTSKLDNGLTGAEDIEMLNRLASEGKIYFQDKGSQMVADAVEITPGGRFLDVCAAPGSKATRIADLNRAEGKLLVAGDLHSARVGVLKENCERQDVDFVSIVQYDAMISLPFADETFDAVLVDAPCSGTGTIRHNPEIRYFLEPSDFSGLSNKQLRILMNASKVVKPGGKLIYSTCSLEKEENEGVCVRFMAESAGMIRQRPDVPEEFITREGFARTFPQRDDMDGFFIAVFKKK